MLPRLFNKLKFLFSTFSRYQNWLEILRHHKTKKLNKIILRSGVSFIGDSSSQLFPICEEIFFNRVYQKEMVRVERGDTVVDIGANVGIFAVHAFKMGAVKLLLYEPFPNNVKLIKRNLRLNKIFSAQVFEKGVSDKRMVSKLYVGDVDSGNLFFDHNITGPLKKFIKVKTITFHDIFTQNKLEKIDFVKMDCEGSEGAIFSSTPQDTLQKIHKIALEFHDNVSLLSHQQIIKKLKLAGFKTWLVWDKVSPFGYIYALNVKYPHVT